MIIWKLLLTGRRQSRVGCHGCCQYFRQFLPFTSNGRITFTNDGSRHDRWKDSDGVCRFSHFASLGHPVLRTFLLSFAEGKIVSYYKKKYFLKLEKSLLTLEKSLISGKWHVPSAILPIISLKSGILSFPFPDFEAQNIICPLFPTFDQENSLLTFSKTIIFQKVQLKF